MTIAHGVTNWVIWLLQWLVIGAVAGAVVLALWVIVMRLRARHRP